MTLRSLPDENLRRAERMIRALYDTDPRWGWVLRQIKEEMRRREEEA